MDTQILLCLAIKRNILSHDSHFCLIGKSTPAHFPWNYLSFPLFIYSFGLFACFFLFLVVVVVCHEIIFLSMLFVCFCCVVLTIKLSVKCVLCVSVTQYARRNHHARTSVTLNAHGIISMAKNRQQNKTNKIV